MDTLTDRYVWAVTHRLPPARRPVVGEELRARIAAAVQTDVATGTEPEDAEKRAVTSLGDPERRLAELRGSPGYLIGPTWFFAYRRILIIVLSAVAPSVFGALLLVQALAGEELWPAAATALTVVFSVAVQVAFWITVAFAVIDRVSRGRRTQGEHWDVSDLPVIPTARVGVGETVVALLAYLLFIGLVLWQRNIWVVPTAGGEAVAVLDAELWRFWIPWFLGVALLEIVFALAAFAIGRWTWLLATINVVLNLAFAIPAIWLVSTDAVLSGEFLATFPDAAPFIGAVVTVMPVIIGAAALLDSLDGFRKAYSGRPGGTS